VKPHAITDTDLSWERPSDRADPQVVREPAGRLAEPAPADEDAGAAGTGDRSGDGTADGGA
jgi:hypothetical protein